MAKLVEITVSYHRRVQIAQYEPAEAVVSYKVAFSESEDDRMEVENYYFGLARERVYTELARDLKAQDSLRKRLLRLKDED